VFFWFRDDFLKSDFCLPVYEIMQEYWRLNMHFFVRNRIIRFLLAYYEFMKVNCGPVACTVVHEEVIDHIFACRRLKLCTDYGPGTCAVCVWKFLSHF
jgi:hypothetical protein